MSVRVVSDTCWARLSEYLEATLGLHYPRERWGDMQRAMVNVAREFGFDGIESCIDWLLSTPPTRLQIEILATHLTIGETYFFREKKTLETIAAKVLPELLRARSHTRRLRVWSAACCTGEEAYSLAILLRQSLPDIDQWQISILATDINPKFLKKAAEGIYSEWSFRTTRPEFKAQYFQKLPDNRYIVAPEIKSMVTFAHLNLVDDVYPSPLTCTEAMDLIFCRNVLIYFSSEQNTRIVRKLYNCLSEDGWLVVSPCETSQTLFAKYMTRNFPGVILYQKKPLLIPDSLSLDPVSQLGAPDETPLEIAGLPGDLESESATFDSTKMAVNESTEAPSPNPKPDAVARKLANEGRLDEALAACEQWIADDKLNASAHYLRGVILLELNNADGARQAFQSALFLAPDFVLAHYALGNLARGEGKPVVAEKHFNNALRLLKGRDANQLIDESEGLTAGRLRDALTHRTETGSTK